MDQTAMNDGRLAFEYNAEFDKMRRDRVIASFYKYGPARKNFGEGRVDALATAQRCLDAFEKDHNLHDFGRAKSRGKAPGVQAHQGYAPQV